MRSAQASQRKSSLGSNVNHELEVTRQLTKAKNSVPAEGTAGANVLGWQSTVGVSDQNEAGVAAEGRGPSVQEDGDGGRGQTTEGHVQR